MGKKQKTDENKNYFNAEKFVDNLLKSGVTPCDKGTKSFDEQTDVPSYYNEELYKRGCEFYNKHYFAVFMNKIFGLIAVLAIPTINQILRFTKQSSSNETAYKRYIETIFHVSYWYEDEFKPGSKRWNSINDVRNKHSSTSKRACTAGLGNITQKDMVLTQFGFVGFALTQRENIGIFGATPEEWKGFVHVWRVIGYLIGIEERFNICRESLEETTEICNVLIKKVFLPEVQKKDKHFIEMSMYILDGLWCFNPLLNAKVYFAIFYNLLLNNNVEKKDNSNEYLALGPYEKKYLNFNFYMLPKLKYTFWRWYFNGTQRVAVWFAHYFPALAYFSYGMKYARVTILKNKSD